MTEEAGQLLALMFTRCNDLDVLKKTVWFTQMWLYEPSEFSSTHTQKKKSFWCVMLTLCMTSALLITCFFVKGPCNNFCLFITDLLDLMKMLKL